MAGRPQLKACLPGWALPARFHEPAKCTSAGGLTHWRGIGIFLRGLPRTRFQQIIEHYVEEPGGSTAWGCGYTRVCSRKLVKYAG